MWKEIHKQDKTFSSSIGDQRIKTSFDYRWSIYAIQEEREGRTILFHTMTTQCILLEDEQLPKGILSAKTVENHTLLFWLMQQYFLVPVDFSEEEFYRKTIYLLRKLTERKGYVRYTILPTTGCNARCVYCFEKGYPIQTMSEETAEQVVRFISETKCEHQPIQLGWFGGEPLLGQKIIDWISDRLREKEILFTSSMVTNGSLFTDDVIEKARTRWNLNHVQISMDCAETVYRQRKQFLIYDHQYETVLRQAAKAAKAGISVTIGCNVDGENVDEIPEFIRDAANRISEKGKVTILFPQLFQSRSSKENCLVLKKIMQYDDVLEQYGFPGIYQGLPDHLKLFSCMADGKNREVVIAPDGKLYACEHCEEGTSFGTIWDGITDPLLLNSYEEWDETKDNCRECPYLPLCTPFSKCSVVDFDCQAIRTMVLHSAMQSMMLRELF